MPRHQIRSETIGIVFQIAVKPGQKVAADDELVVLEAMKMELPVFSPLAGVVVSVEVEEGAEVAEGDVVAVLETE